ncbi:MAG TPA: hypothetical protein VGL38_06590 [bacterium]|jgi:hypothetical protein
MRKAFFCAALLLLTIPLYARMISADPTSALVLRESHSLDEDACPPSTIVSLPITINGNTTASASNFTLACPDFNPATGPDDIYALSLACLTSVSVALCGSSYDTVVEVRRGTNYGDCPGSYVITCNDDACGPIGRQSTVGFTAEVGQYYFIIISGYNGDRGAYSLVVTGTSFPPSNDNCSGSRLIDHVPYTDFGSTACALNDITPPCAFSNAPDVVYTLQLPCDAWVTATTCGHPLMDAVLFVRTGGGCAGSTPVACNDDACPNNQSSVSFGANANQAYYIIVDGWNTSNGYYVLNVTATTGHDSCAGDYLLAFPLTITGDTRCGNNDHVQCNYGESKEDWYFFNVQQCSQITASLCGTGNFYLDPVMEVWTGPTCPPDSLIACADDGLCDGSPTLNPTVTWQADPGRIYYIIVEGYGGSEGPYVLSCSSAPCGPPPAVADLVISAQPDIGVIQLDWSPVPGASAYNVYAGGADCSPGVPCHLIGTTQGNSFADDASLGGPETVRMYEVTAVNSGQPPAMSLPGKALPVPRIASQPVTFRPLIPYDYAPSAQKPQAAR